MSNQLLKKLLIAVSGIFILTSCATTTGYDNKSNDTEAQVIGNKDSSIVPHRTLDEHYSLEILSSGVVANNYVRITSVKLDDLPVIAAISKTNLKNQTFVNILKNSGSTTIGKSLSTLSPRVERNGDFKITNITVKDIQNPTIHAYLTSLGYKESKKIIVRKSVFTYKTETMILTEFILPSAEDYTNFYLITN